MKYDVIKNRKIKVALVGCGRISKNHINALLQLNSEFQLVALCDNQEYRVNEAIDLIEKITNDLGIKKELPDTYKDFESLIDFCHENKEYLDLIVLATPSGFHPEQVIKSAEAGINVCTEKPMATKWEDGLRMVSICKKESIRLFVVKQNRLNKTLQLLKKQVDNNRFGKIAMISVNVFWQRPESYYKQDSWRGTIDLDGGALMNQASHYVDLLHWLVGPVEEISASIATIGRKIEVEDTASIQLRLKNGGLGTMSVTMLTYPKNLEGSITVLGEKGTVKIGGTAVNKIEKWEFEEPTDDDKLIKDASYDIENIYGFGHKNYYQNVIDTFKGISKPLCDGEEGLKSLELIVAAYESAKLNSFIKLPLKF